MSTQEPLLRVEHLKKYFTSKKKFLESKPKTVREVDVGSFVMFM